MTLEVQLIRAARLLAIGLSLVFLAVAVRYRDRPGSRGFAVFVTGTALWAFAAAVDISTPDYERSRLIYNVLVLAAELAVVGWVVLSLEVTERFQTTEGLLTGLVGWVVVMQLLLWTNPAHQLMLGSGTTVENIVLVPEYNAGFWIHAVVSYSLILAAVGLLAFEARRSAGLRRKQLGLLALAAIPSIAGTLVSLFDVLFAPYDLAPFGFLLTAAVLGVVLFDGRFLDIVPVARRTAMAEVTDAILVLDEQNRLIDCNEAARQLFDIQNGCAGTPASELFDSTQPDFVARLLEGDGERQATIERGGTQRHLLISSSPIGKMDDRGQVVVCHDITALREREKHLERQNERLDQFASVVSHDLRNPLNVAMGRLEIARAEHDNEHLAAVASAHGRMEQLIADVLALAREKEPVTETDWVDLRALTTTSWENVETAGASLITDTTQVIRADTSRLQQLLENVLRNAIEHGGDEVTVTVGEIADGFYVSDDGPGIAIERSAMVFETGYSTAGTGAGLGLNIVRQIAHAHGWEIQVVENDSGGARFEIMGVEIER